MIAFLVDQDLDNVIVTGLRRRIPEVDLIYVRDVGLERSHDLELLEFAFQERRVILTHDAATMPKWFKSRIEAGDHCSAVVIVKQGSLLAHTIDQVAALAVACTEEELRNQVIFLPWSL